MYTYRAKVLKVHDADTIFVEADLGFHIKKQLWVRLLAVDAPELKTPEGQAAREFVVNWLFQGKIDAPIVTISTMKERDGDERQTFGRYLAFVLNDRGEGLASALIKAGHAKKGKGDG